MSLQEKRIRQQIEEQDIPAYEQQYKGIIGKEIKIKVDWDSFENDSRAMERITPSLLMMLAGGLKLICTDIIGREAVGQNIKTILFKNIPTEKAQSRNITLINGLLTIECNAYGRRYADQEYKDAIEPLLVVSSVASVFMPNNTLDEKTDAISETAGKAGNIVQHINQMKAKPIDAMLQHLLALKLQQQQDFVITLHHKSGLEFNGSLVDLLLEGNEKMVLLNNTYNSANNKVSYISLASVDAVSVNYLEEETIGHLSK